MMTLTTPPAAAPTRAEPPFLLWLTGLSGAGKSTIAGRLLPLLAAQGRRPILLDGDHLREGLCADLGFSEADRRENIRRAAEVALLMVGAGLTVVATFISPFRRDRDNARARMTTGRFVEVFIDTPLAVAEERDPKGLYRRARAGQIPHFTGISSPYEAPVQPEIRIDTTRLSPERAAEHVVASLREMGLLPPAR